MTLDRWITDAAITSPDAMAIEFGDDNITYAQLATKINECVNTFGATSIKHGDRVAWYGLNHPDVFVLLFACARLGAIFVPLNWRLAEPEVAAIVANCTPNVVYHDQHFAEQAQALTDVPVFSNDAIYPSNGTNTHQTDLNKSALQRDASVTAKLSDPLLLVYTSGSTGLPKGAVLSQKAVACNAAMSIDAHGMHENDVALVMLPLFHVGGLNILATPALSAGATIILHERFDPDQACKDLERASIALTVPTVLKAIMNSALWNNLNLSSLKAMSIGSTDVPVSLIESIHALGIPMPQIYGATETGPFAIYQTIKNAMNSVGSIGQAGTACNIRLVKDGIDVSDGESGEIWVKGDNVLIEYWKDPELTSNSIQDDWFRTGDVATRDANGYYWFADRIKHVIISGGENIYPTEIERILAMLDGVVEVAVVGKADSIWGEIPVAVVVTNKNLNKSDILGSLEGQLARYKHPKEVIFVDALPRNAMGKVVADAVKDVI